MIFDPRAAAVQMVARATAMAIAVTLAAACTEQVTLAPSRTDAVASPRRATTSTRPRDPCDVSRGEIRPAGCAAKQGDEYVPPRACVASEPGCAGGVLPGGFRNTSTDPSPRPRSGEDVGSSSGELVDPGADGVDDAPVTPPDNPYKPPVTPPDNPYKPPAPGSPYRPPSDGSAPYGAPSTGAPSSPEVIES